jgi:pimeloyl-ACP methyl ester carboxylesterase
VDVIGLSTGGSIAQHFAADHPELVQRLILHSTAYRLSDSARALQLELARLARDEKWFRANVLLFGVSLPARGIWAVLARPLIWLGAGLMTLNAPEDPYDLVVTIMAEDVFNFKGRLGEIAAPTLVAGGTADPFYSPALFRETAAGIPDARLGLYAGAAHPAAGSAFEADVRAFLDLPGGDGRSAHFNAGA